MKRTIIDLFEESVAKYATKEFLLEKYNGKFEPTTYEATRQEVLKVGAGLVALGIKPESRVSILAEGCNNWIISELGLLYAGAISVPLSIKLEEANDLLFRLNHADVETIFVSKYQLPKIRRIKEQLPLLKNIIVFNEDAELEEGEMLLSTLKELGDKHLAEHSEEFMAISAALQNDDYATITYTSGTTADPKGVVLTHRNYTANVEQALTRISIPPTYRTLIILPLDHCFAHVCGFYIMIACGAAVATTQVGKTPMETLRNVPLNIREVKPHFLLSVPALAKNFRKSIETSIRNKGSKTEKLFKFALAVSYEYNQDGFHKGKGWRFILKPLVALFDKILYSKVRQAFGGELQFFVGGGALLDAELQRFFYAVGMPMYQGYGLSEATPIISTNTIGDKQHRFGSSGKLIQPLDIKILDDEGREMQVGEKVAASQIVATERFTVAPPRYNEASLVKRLEELGIGRPSTYAPTITTIINRGYVVKQNKEAQKRNYLALTLSAAGKLSEKQLSESYGKEKNRLAPTDIGMVVNDYLESQFEQIMDYNFTASVEKEFDRIAEGDITWNEMIKRFYSPFHTLVDKAIETQTDKNNQIRVLGIDPESGKQVKARIGRYGPMVEIEAEEGEKSRFASLKKGQLIESITLEEALELFALPRNLGKFEGHDLMVGIGKFGPYVRYGNSFASLSKTDDPYTIQYERAVELIEQQKAQAAATATPLKSFAEDKDMVIRNGRYGAYIAYKGKNYRLPAGKKPEEMTYEECLTVVNAPKKSKR